MYITYIIMISINPFRNEYIYYLHVWGQNAIKKLQKFFYVAVVEAYHYISM